MVFLLVWPSLACLLFLLILFYLFFIFTSVIFPSAFHLVVFVSRTSLFPSSPIFLFSFLWLFCHLSRRIRLSFVTRFSFGSSLHHRGLTLSRCASLMRSHSFPLILLLSVSCSAGQSEPGAFLSDPPTFTLNTTLMLRQQEAR